MLCGARGRPPCDATKTLGFAAPLHGPSRQRGGPLPGAAPSWLPAQRKPRSGARGAARGGAGWPRPAAGREQGPVAETLCLRRNAVAVAALPQTQEVAIRNCAARASRSLTDPRSPALPKASGAAWWRSRRASGRPACSAPAAASCTPQRPWAAAARSWIRPAAPPAAARCASWRPAPGARALGAGPARRSCAWCAATAPPAPRRPLDRSGARGRARSACGTHRPRRGPSAPGPARPGGAACAHCCPPTPAPSPRGAGAPAARREGGQPDQEGDQRHVREGQGRQQRSCARPPPPPRQPAQPPARQPAARPHCTQPLPRDGSTAHRRRWSRRPSAPSATTASTTNCQRWPASQTPMSQTTCRCGRLAWLAALPRGRLAGGCLLRACALPGPGWGCGDCAAAAARSRPGLCLAGSPGGQGVCEHLLGRQGQAARHQQPEARGAVSRPPACSLPLASRRRRRRAGARVLPAAAAARVAHGPAPGPRRRPPPPPPVLLERAARHAQR
jgi:hypothetical protein